MGKGFFEITKESQKTSFQNVEKLYIFINVIYWKSLVNEVFSQYNSQPEFTSNKKDRKFQDMYAYGTNCLYFHLLVKDLNEMDF